MGNDNNKNNDNKSTEQQNKIINFNEEIEILEHLIQKHGGKKILAGPLTKTEIDELYENEPCMCKIRFETEKNGLAINNGTGTGFFCKFKYSSIPFEKALFTNNHILNRESIKVGNVIKIENSNKTIKITDERKTFTNEELDYTCIEILEEDKIYNFFEIDDSILNNRISLKNEEIFILQYPNNKPLSFSAGKIINIRQNKIIHSAITDFGSSGSPLIRRNRNTKNYVIGIHFGSVKTHGNLATCFDDILKDIRLRMINNNIDNLIIAKFNIKEDNYRARIINSYENAVKEGLNIKEIGGLDKNENEIKNCDIYINNLKIDFNYFYIFPQKGHYEIIYIFHNLISSTNFMFYNCRDIEELDLSLFDSNNVSNICGMFNRCETLVNLNLTNFMTEKITNMSWLFNECGLLTNLDLSCFNTKNVKDMSQMFNRCYKLKNIEGISKFNTENVENMIFMFWRCESLEDLDLSRFNTKNVKNMCGMFSKCKSLKNINLSGFNTENVTGMREMFMECTSLQNLDLSNFKIEKVKDILGMFADCEKLSNLTITNFNISNIQNPNWIFSGCKNLKKQNVICNDLKLLNYFN